MTKIFFSADVKADRKQEEVKNWQLYLFIRSTSKLEIKRKQACIFYLILLGIPCSLIFSVKNMGWERGVYLMEKIC